MEACGFDAWLADKIESFGIKVILSHPGKTKAIAEAKGLTNYKSLKKTPLIDLIKSAE